jgi:hypothetical protein
MEYKRRRFIERIAGPMTVENSCVPQAAGATIDQIADGDAPTGAPSVG